jgi:hypothetical protein
LFPENCRFFAVSEIPISDGSLILNFPSKEAPPLNRWFFGSGENLRTGTGGYFKRIK